MPEHPHKGHRQRMRNRFLKSSLDSFEPHEVLELLLSYSIPLRNVNPLAHSVIKRFGSVRGALEADVDELLKVNGLGAASAEYIKLLMLLIESYPLVKYSESQWLLTPVGMVEHCEALFEDEKSSDMMLIGLNLHGKVLGQWPVVPDFGEIGIANTSSELDIANQRAIANLAMQSSAYAIVIAVRRDASAALTEADEDFISKLPDIIKPLGTNIMDMIIVGNDGACSAAGNDLVLYDENSSGFMVDYIDNAASFLSEGPVLPNLPDIVLDESTAFAAKD